MLLNFDPACPVYIVGTSVSTLELQSWVQADVEEPVQSVSVEQFFELPDNAQCIIGFQTLKYRLEFLKKSKDLLRVWPSYVHPKSFVGSIDQLGSGVVIHPLACVGHSAEVGNFSVVCPQVSIGHGTRVGSNVVVSPGTTIGGSSYIGDNILFGQACSVKDKITICGNVEFYMNSVVTKDITTSGTYYGNKQVND